MGKHITAASLLIAFGYLFATPLAAQDSKPLTENDVRGVADKLRNSWVTPAGHQNQTIRMKIKLNRDGTLAAPPEFVSGDNDPISNNLRESALRAIYAAQPFKLNPASYEKWKELDLVFRPTDATVGDKPPANALPPPPAPPKPPGAPPS